jgi:aerobic carbon-monoxide dehydrogenase large subunit
MGEYALGQPVPRFEDLRLVRGGGRYVDDMTLPGMAFGFVLRSPYAHARIRRLDTSAALQARGVIAVLTHEDWVAAGFGDLPTAAGFKRPDGSPMYAPEFPALVRERVRWNGDCVAFVVAETLWQAMDASELVEVEYDPLPPILSTAQAAEPGAPLVWDDCANNICYVHAEGDRDAAERALSQAPRRMSRRLIVSRVTAATMEPRGSIGQYEPISGRYTIYTTLQRTHGYRTEVARMLNVPESRVRVVAGDIGGSFGMKSGVYNEVGCVLLASKVLGRPVKWTSTRTEAFLSDASGRDIVVDAELGLDEEGHFLGFKVKMLASVGAYTQPGAQGAGTSNLGTLGGVYTIPAIRVDVTGVYTNTNPMRPYRGNGRPEAAYVIERMIDLAADELKIDPAEIRRRNLIPASALPYTTALNFVYDSGEFEKNMDIALELSDYPGFEARRAESRARGKLRGIGVSNSIEKAAAPGYEGAEVRFDGSGTATIVSGAVTQGQGHETIFKQLVCDRLGLAPQDVHYVQGDTDLVFFGEGTGGSRTATIGGAALDLATKKVVAKAARIAAHVMKVDDVDFAEGVFRSRKTNQSMTIQEVARAAIKPQSLPPDTEPGLVEKAVYYNPNTNYPNGCHVCEVEIDEETGVVEILRYNVVDDVGNVLNPLLLKGQIHGGVAQGVGQMLMEQVVYDAADGQNLTGSFMDYAMPRASDLSNMEVHSNPAPTPGNPLGVKGAGEAGCVGALPAVANAIADALSIFGVDDVAMPATPARLWRLMRDAKAERALAQS